MNLKEFIDVILFKLLNLIEREKTVEQVVYEYIETQ